MAAEQNLHKDIPAEDANDDLPTMSDVVEKIGLGPAQARYCLTGGGVYVADGAELLLISCITDAVGDEWGLQALQRGLLVTIVYFGMLTGNMSSGPLGDRYGRRVTICASYLAVVASCIASSYAQNYETLCLARMLVGWSIGLGIPAYNAIAAEITPKYWRIVMQAGGSMCFAAGEIFTCILILFDDPAMTNLHWRPLVRYACLPGIVFFLLGVLFLYESPAFLAVNGFQNDGEAVLAVNARNNGFANMDVRFKPISKLDPSRHQGIASDFLVLFRGNLLASTLVCAFTCLVCNFVYYGSFYAFPQILPDVSDDSISAAMQLLVGALWEIPGNCLSVPMGLYFSRKLVLKVALLANAICIFWFVIGTTKAYGWITSAMWHAGYYGIKCFTGVLFSAAYLYASEVYPTSVRTTGNAVCVACGRIGAMSAPLLYEVMAAKTGSHGLFFWIMGILALLNAWCIDFSPFEPTTQELLDHVDEVDKLNVDAEAQSYGVSNRTE